ncbi:hypothetical protein D9619_012079 [Psilocybe cf. subviscida]|uniref:tRNA-guanine(15) transglycosylase-like domain-containing protein n=1 Tax=Psilocybe cf. subviscida TaxID=2480587 RepID=A0A8H5B7F3_9AGAR|nr:hypothetical protein D9619_012079 [Psilocybe cf. subviscida]
MGSIKSIAAQLFLRNSTTSQLDLIGHGDDNKTVTTKNLKHFSRAIMSHSTFKFELASPAPQRFGPRLGSVKFRRLPSDETTDVPSYPAQREILTPGLLATTSRGVIPHLSRDHARGSDAVRWVNVPFETFLEQKPPMPTLQPGFDPLHKFLGFTPGTHLLSLSVRDPSDTRDMPPSGNQQLSVMSLRGVRKVSPVEWRSWVTACAPDVVFALSDQPFVSTDAPYSQKRLTKSIERSADWLASLMQKGTPLPNIFVHLAGCTNAMARVAFAQSLMTPLYGPEADAVAPLARLDDGVRGYAVDLAPLHECMEASTRKAGEKTEDTFSSITGLVKDSLAALDAGKPRLVNGTRSPHEILALISDPGIELFDAKWVQDAAGWGIGLDFQFPVREHVGSKKRELGHNLYDLQYRLDFGAVASCFSGAAEDDVGRKGKDVCPCISCSPRTPASRLYHGYDAPEVSGEPTREAAPRPPHTRAYIHHLLHTHEMGAHTLLVAHNLAVLDAFFTGVRRALAECRTGAGSDGEALDHDRWTAAVREFGETYDGGLKVFEEARVSWREVDLARGKGRLAREKEREVQTGGLEGQEAVVLEDD